MNEVDRRIIATGDAAAIESRIRAIFGNRRVGIAAGNESEAARIGRLVGEVLSGRRDFDSIRGSVDAIAAGRTRQAPYNAGPSHAAADAAVLASYDPNGVKARIREIFRNRGVPIAAGNEREEDRLNRIAFEITSGQRTFDDLRRSVDSIRAGRTPQAPFNPNAPRPGAGISTDVASRDAAASIRGIMIEYGLPSSLADWAWNQIVSGRSEAEVMLDMRRQPAWRDRFKAIVQAEEAGLPALSPREVVEYEKAAVGILSRLGAPAEFYNDPQNDFVDQIVAGWSPLELQERATEALVRANNAPPEVKAVYNEWFGADGTSALLALYLNPDKAGPVLERMLTTAEVAGTGRRFGANLSFGRASQLYEVGVDMRQAQQGFEQLDELAPIFQETVGEGGRDLTLEGEGVDAIFGLGEGGRRAIEERRQQRLSTTQGSAGSLFSEEGVRGVGTAT